VKAFIKRNNARGFTTNWSQFVSVCSAHSSSLLSISILIQIQIQIQIFLSLYIIVPFTTRGGNENQFISLDIYPHRHFELYPQYAPTMDLSYLLTQTAQLIINL
jgi:hypothetical protein